MNKCRFIKFFAKNRTTCSNDVTDHSSYCTSHLHEVNTIFSNYNEYKKSFDGTSFSSFICSCITIGKNYEDSGTRCTKGTTTRDGFKVFIFCTYHQYNGIYLLE